MITKEQKVADVFERVPQTQAVFAQFGFQALSNPILRKTFGKVTSIERGCKMHRVPLESFLDALNRAASQTSPSLGSPEPLVSAPSRQPNTRQPQPARTFLETNVGVLVQKHPEVKAVFIKYFGPGCFDCPAFGTETVGFACLMHHTDPGRFAGDCLALMGDSQSAGGKQ